MILEARSARHSFGEAFLVWWNGFAQTVVGDLVATFLSIGAIFAAMLVCVIAIAIVVEISTRILGLH